MQFAHFFVDRPIFATVLSLVLVITGLIAFVQLPVSQYPEIAPPTVVVEAVFPGANAETVAATVATPLEQEINGVEGMIYMSSYSTSDGRAQITITFGLGTDIDQAQVLVQNRVAVAEPRLPEEVRRQGVTTAKSSPDLMMVVHMLSPDETYDQLYVSNYARARVRDELVRLQGIGNLLLFGEREYSIRVWLDPDKLASYGLTAADAIAALREQNVQVSSGAIGAPPSPDDTAFQVTISTQGRFSDPRDFRNIIVKSTDDGRTVRIWDIARVELGARDYITNSYLNGKPAVALGIFQRPGTNALETAEQIKATMARLAEDFPPGLAYEIVYNPTEFIEQSIDAVYLTLFEAVILVVLVVLIFLQSWRTALIPIAAIPVSLIGTFVFMAAMGFSINLLTLFGLVLAIGIVVDDAILVVENIERNVREGLSPREAAHKTMDEVGSAIIATSVVLAAVFVPTAFIPGITGQFYQQFAVTIIVSTAISTFNSLTLSPALAALLLKPHDAPKPKYLLTRGAAWFADRFNAGFDRFSSGYAGTIKVLVGGKVMRLGMMLVFAGLLYGTYQAVESVPRGFIPQLDQGYAIVVVQLPDGASLNRTDEVVLRATEIVRNTPGVKNAVGFAGFSGATFTNATNSGVIFAAFEPFETRLEDNQPAGSIIGELYGGLQQIQEAFIIAIPPPPVRGVGNAGGFKLMLQERESADMSRVLGLAYQLMGTANQDPNLTSVFTTFSASSPQIFLEIDRKRAQILNVPIERIFETLSINLGTTYVNDFNAFGRVYQVRAQADTPYRLEIEDIEQLKVRADNGAMVPLGTLADVQLVSGPDLVQRYNLYTAVPLQGEAAPGISSGDALDTMEELTDASLPPGMSFEWTELAFQERQTGDTAVYIFMLSVLFVFLALAAQYESWVLPLAIILIVPMAVLSAMLGTMARGMDNNILTQIGLVVLIALAAKNAILIVEFAKQAEERGLDVVAAAVEACRLRLRPILMTAFAFILGVVPLMIATGAAAEMRQALGTTVFSGMLGVTFFGLILTPVFYVVLRMMVRRRKQETAAEPPAEPPAGEPASSGASD